MPSHRRRELQIAVGCLILALLASTVEAQLGLGMYGSPYGTGLGLGSGLGIGTGLGTGYGGYGGLGGLGGYGGYGGGYGTGLGGGMGLGYDPYSNYWRCRTLLGGYGMFNPMYMGKKKK